MIEKLIEKFDRPKVRLTSHLLLWISIIILARHFDMKFFSIQDYVNDNCQVYKPMFFPDLNTTQIEIDMSEIQRMDNG